MINTKLFDDRVLCIKEHFDKVIKSQISVVSDELQKRNSKNATGIYLFSEIIDNTEVFMYVGQSNDIYKRLCEHCAIKDYKRANFAYMLTIELTNLKPIPGSPDSTKLSMFNIPEFRKGFDSVIERIKKMNYRWIKVENKLEKNLLEIYASVVLNSRFNDFN